MQQQGITKKRAEKLAPKFRDESGKSEHCSMHLLEDTREARSPSDSLALGFRR
jgi:hypothetical protein